MNTFKNIPIKVEDALPLDETAIAKSVLHEIHALTENFLETGQGGAIDLRSLPPLGTVGYQFLKEWLSTGEVSATVEGITRSEARETAFPGVWWITHRNEKDNIVTELIEISHIPDFLLSHKEDIQAGLAKMSEKLPASS